MNNSHTRKVFAEFFGIIILLCILIVFWQGIAKNKTYHYVSLKNLLDEEIIQYMGEGFGGTQISKGFWTSSAKKSALATVAINRTPAHKKHYRLVLFNAQKPPKISSIRYSYSSNNSYSAIKYHFYFLCIDPKKSFLLFTHAWEPGYVQPRYDFRYCELKYEEAKHISQIIWWMSHVSSQILTNDTSFSSFSSSGDGFGTLQILWDKNEFKIHGRSWGTPISRRWLTEYDDEVFLNLGEYVIEQTLPKRLGEIWLKRKQSKNIKQTVAKILDLFSLDQKYVSHRIVLDGVSAAGNLCFIDFREKLVEIANKLPTQKKPIRTREIILEEIKKLEEEKDFEKKDFKKISAKYRELEDLDLGIHPENIQKKLKKAIQFALQKIDTANNPKSLLKWACSKTAGHQWALQRLQKIDSKRYVIALEWQLKKVKGEEIREVFKAIAKADPHRAKELASKLPAGPRGEITLSVYSIVNLDKAIVIPNRQKRIKALIAVALDHKSGQRKKAILYLVPEDDPLKYRNKNIDKALAKLLHSDYTLEKACQALALRKDLKYFDMIVECLPRAKESFIFHKLIGSLTYLAQNGEPKHKAKLSHILKQHLKQTNDMITEIIWCIWAADLRKLKTDLERIATSGPKAPQGEVDRRYHLARKVVALWNEENLFTKTKLLIAFALHEDINKPERLKRLKLELSRLLKILDKSQIKMVKDFFIKCRKTLSLQQQYTKPIKFLDNVFYK